MDGFTILALIIICIGFFVTVIALVAIVFGKSDIAGKAISSLGNALKVLAGNTPKLE